MCACYAYTHPLNKGYDFTFFFFFFVSAYKIHISNFTYLELKNIGGYKFERRGTIPVKVSRKFKIMSFSQVNILNKCSLKNPFLKISELHQQN